MEAPDVVNDRIGRWLRSQTHAPPPWHAPLAQGERKHVQRRRALALAKQKKDDK
ncbi:hypothetical protein [Massilia sp. CCM 8734]|uniref:hypothetical protein n=1 Tax=Massilia sp. CCM 8734 TaxID=2609283 RepID=UPI00141E05F6|nr:hypothetical protein [Massilia sp. CCM 8734]